MLKCFVIMGFTDDLREVFNVAIREAAQNSGYSCMRADSTSGADDITDTIIRNIVTSDVVIVDLTHPKPNVYFELGIAFSSFRPTICISQTTDLPFDVRNYRVLVYEKDRLEELRLKLEYGLRDLSKYSTNPVLISGNAYFDLRKQIELNLDEVIRERKRAGEFARFSENRWADNSLVANKLIDLVQRKVSLQNRKPLIAISGAGSIGKSTFSHTLKEQLKKRLPEFIIEVLPTDTYMMDRSERKARNITGFDIRSHDLSKFEQDVNELISGRDVHVRPYDHTTGKHSDKILVRSPDVLILDGIHAMHPPIERLISYSAFIYAPKFIVKELKFLADYMFRGYPPATAFEHSEREYLDFEEHVLPYYKQADSVISVVGYWRYRLRDHEGTYVREPPGEEV